MPHPSWRTSPGTTTVNGNYAQNVAITSLACIALAVVDFVAIVHWPAVARAAFADLVPAPIMTRGKMGFGIDGQQYLMGYLPVVMLTLHAQYGVLPRMHTRSSAQHSSALMHVPLLHRRWPTQHSVGATHEPSAQRWWPGQHVATMHVPLQEISPVPAVTISRSALS